VLAAQDVNSVDQVKKKWKNLKDVFFRKKKEARGFSGCGPDQVSITWPFFRY